MKQTGARKRSTKGRVAMKQGRRMRSGGMVMVMASPLANAPRGVRVGDAIMVDGAVEKVVEVINFNVVRTETEMSELEELKKRVSEELGLAREALARARAVVAAVEGAGASEQA